MIDNPRDFKPFKFHGWDWMISICREHFWPPLESYKCLEVDQITVKLAIELGACANNPKLPPPPISPEIGAELLDSILGYARTETANFKLKPQYHDKNFLREMCVLNPRIMVMMEKCLNRVPEYVPVFSVLRELGASMPLLVRYKCADPREMQSGVVRRISQER